VPLHIASCTIRNVDCHLLNEILACMVTELIVISHSTFLLDYVCTCVYLSPQATDPGCPSFPHTPYTPVSPNAAAISNTQGSQHPLPLPTHTRHNQHTPSVFAPSPLRARRTESLPRAGWTLKSSRTSSTSTVTPRRRSNQRHTLDCRSHWGTKTRTCGPNNTSGSVCGGEIIPLAFKVSGAREGQTTGVSPPAAFSGAVTLTLGSTYGISVNFIFNTATVAAIPITISTRVTTAKSTDIMPSVPVLLP
jgi:hypothetical protein